MGTKTIAALAQLFTGIAALCIAVLQYHKSGSQPNPLFWSVFVLFTSSLLIDKIGLVFSNWSLEGDEKDLRLKIERQPSLFAGRNDVVTFANDAEGTKYCVAVSALAIGVKNTVLRYQSSGYAALNEDDTPHYDAWMKFKKHSVENHSCTWTEIVSKHIGKPAIEGRTGELIERTQSRFYSYRFLDETKHPMIQMTIIRLSNGTKEIVFGWEFPGIPHGPCFLTKNEEIISYFEEYFDHFWSISSDPVALKTYGLATDP